MGVDAFSLCFGRYDADPGQLVLGGGLPTLQVAPHRTGYAHTAHLPDPCASPSASALPCHLAFCPSPRFLLLVQYSYVPVVGERHWAIQLLNVGFDIPTNQRGALACSSPPFCATIIDSGTSLIAGPPQLLNPLVDSLKPQLNEDCSNVNQLPDLLVAAAIDLPLTGSLCTASVHVSAFIFPVLSPGLPCLTAILPFLSSTSALRAHPSRSASHPNFTCCAPPRLTPSRGRRPVWRLGSQMHKSVVHSCSWSLTCGTTRTDQSGS